MVYPSAVISLNTNTIIEGFWLAVEFFYEIANWKLFEREIIPKRHEKEQKGEKISGNIFRTHFIFTASVRHCIRYIYLSFFALFLPDRHENWNTKARQKSAAIMVKLFLSIFEIFTLQTRFRSSVFLVHTSNLFKADVKLNKKYFAFFPSWSICKGHNRAKT